MKLLNDQNQYCGEQQLDPATESSIQRRSKAAESRAKARAGVKSTPVWYSMVSDMPLQILKKILTTCEPVAFSEGNLKVCCVRGDLKNSQEELARQTCDIMKTFFCVVK